ncbi:MAG: peptidoglycan DD-metalloendopeptidase family protein [Microgenomates group bacterium]
MLKIFLTSFVVALLSIFNFQVHAAECDGLGINEKIECLKKETEKLSGQSKTLSSQISQFDAQIKLTTLKVEQTQEKIDQLSGRIDQLEGSLGSLTEAFSERVVETYKMSKVNDPLLLLISSPNLNEVFSRYSYLRKIQDADRDLLQRLQQAQDTYKDERVDQEQLQNELESQQKLLNTQKLAKKLLLDQTKNDEKKYQTLLSQALAEKAAIEKALVSGTKVGPVKAGDPIAMVGNSGYPSCSTGKHLHFEVRKNNTWVDPAPFLQNKTIQDEEKGGTASIGSGGWQWPLSDPIRMTQHYGHTPWSWRYSYSGGIHTGFDLNSSSSDVIRAPADGNLFKSSEKCGSSTINIVYIEHADSVISFYLHVQ